MNKLLTRLFSVALLMLHTVMMSAQTDSTKLNQLNFGLNVMTHGEMMNGGLPYSRTDVPEKRSSFLLGRFRLLVGYERPYIEVQAVVQNKSVWGTSGSQTLNLYEGWVKAKAPCGLFAQLGRVALSYDDERIIGPNDFAMASLSHDVVRVGYEGHGHQAHAIFAYNQNAEHVYSTTYYDNGSQPYKTMQTFWYHYDVPRFPLGASLLFMNVGMQAGELDRPAEEPSQGENSSKPASTEYQQLYGGYLNFHPRRLTLEAAYYRQTGKIVNATSKGTSDIRAWMLGTKATFQPADSYGFTVGYDYLSGDEEVIAPDPGNIGLIQHTTNMGFCPLFGSRNKFYGIMDYFYQSAYVNGFTPGLQNAFIGGFGNPVPPLNISATYHYLAVATSVEHSKRTLGHSIDLQATYTFSDVVSLSAGYTLMFGTDTLERLKREASEKSARWAWFSLVVSPKLFSTKW